MVHSTEISLFKMKTLRKKILNVNIFLNLTNGNFTETKTYSPSTEMSKENYS